MVQAAFDRLSKGGPHAAVEAMVEEAVATLEVVANDSWVPWAGRLVPHIARRVREEAETKAREEEERRVREEIEAQAKFVRAEEERVRQEEDARIARRERRQQEKLDLFLNEGITVEEFELDSEAEAEKSEVTGEGAGGNSAEMDVDDEGEDEVEVTMERPKGGRKRAPSSPPKPSRKRARASTALAPKPLPDAKAPSVSRLAVACDRYRHYNIQCVPTDEGARCSNCKAKHYKCSLVPAKEGSEPKGLSSGVRRLKVAAVVPPRAQDKQSRKKVPALSGVTLGEFTLNSRVRLITESNFRSWSKRDH